MSQTVDLYEMCPVCGGDGVRTSTGSMDGNPYETSTPCNSCGATGKHLNGSIILDPGLDEIMNKLNQLASDLNKMQADINYIKSKV